jgi:hypothetical protein
MLGMRAPTFSARLPGLGLGLGLVPPILSVALSVALGACAGKERIVVVHDPSTSAGDSSPLDPKADGREGSNDDPDWGIKSPTDARAYAEVIAKVERMASNDDLIRRTAQRGLSVVDVTWEDTGRAEGSALGPNISDLTLQVRRKDESGQFTTALMPVIRFPNFKDKTGDVPADRFFVRVGNETMSGGGSLKSVPLTDILRNIKAFASRPASIAGSGNLLAPRDSHFLVSAQAVFLPIPKTGKATFNPALFNYQSAPGSPAVLSILVTRQGSSMQIIDNRGEDATDGGGQELYFNNQGARAAFTAERKSDVAERIASQGGPKTEDDKSALQKGADMLLLVQVPLKHNHLGTLGGVMPAPATTAAPAAAAAAPPAKPMAKRAPARGAMAEDEKSDVEQAVLGHGPNLGPWNEGHGVRFERDPKFPIRITVQFYKATSNGVASDIDLDSIAKSIGSVYEHAEFVGSLVLPEDDPRRPTAWQKVPHEWFPW